MNNITTYTKDYAGKKLLVNRDFDGPLDLVWRAWTDSEILDQWWAPAPYIAKTKTMNFTEGGHWLFAMIGPDGTEMWGRYDYTKIVVNNYFMAKDGFSNSEGVFNPEFPVLDVNHSFIGVGDKTTVTVAVSFDSEADMKKIVEMGAMEGFTATHKNLDTLLETMRSGKKIVPA